MKIHLFLITFLSLALFVFSSMTSGYFYSKLNWDEVDYINAANQGILANALDRNDPSFIQFSKFGVAKYLNDDELINNVTAEMIPEDEQLFMLRHFHPPLPIYYWSLFASHDSSRSDLIIRSSSVIFLIFFIISFLALANKSVQNFLPLSPIQALLPISFFTSSIFFLSNWSLNFHIFHALACIYFSYSLQRYLEQSSRKNEWILGLALSFLFLTLETAIFVAFFGLIILCFFKGTIYILTSSFYRLMLKAFILFSALWPGALFSGGPLKSWLMYAYRIFANSSEEYATVNIFDNFKDLFFLNPILCLISLVSFLIIFLNRKKILKRSFLIPFFLGISYGVFLAPFALNFTYFIPAFSLIIFALYTGLRSSNV